MKARTMNPMKLIINHKKKSTKVQHQLDDDASSASFSIDGSSHSRKHAHSSAALFHVTFQEDKNVEYECSHDLSVEEIAQELWYSSSDNKQMKEATAFSAKVARGSATCSTSSASYAGSLELAYAACQDHQLPAQDVQQGLHAQMQIQPARRGLEHRLIKALSQDRQSRRDQLVQLVCYMGHGFESDNLAKQCQDISLPAQLFAHQLAQASATR